MNIVNILISSFLWRVRGGLRIKGKKLPANKIWYAIFIGVFSYLKGLGLEISVNATVSTFVSYQLYGWGKYISALVAGVLNKEEKECELIDNLLDPCKITWKGKVYYLNDYPKLYGFCGTTITGLMITYLMGLGMGDFWFGFVGAGMGVCYWLGSLLEKIYPLGKYGWNWGEWIFGAYLGYWLGVLI